MRPNPDMIISTDASTKGWGASMNGEHTGGEFTMEEKEYHINVLELMATLYGLKDMCKHCSNSTILLKMDNTSAVACVNKMGNIRS